MYVCAGGKEMNGKEDVPRDLQGCWGQLLDIRKVEAGMERDATIGRACWAHSSQTRKLSSAVIGEHAAQDPQDAWLYRWCLFPPHTGPGQSVT